MDLTNSLKQFGLDDREAAIYLAALALGPATVQALSKKSGIKRTTIYLVAESLKQKGLISESRDKRRVRLVAEPPESLLDVLRAKENRIKDILPELRAISNKDAVRPRITFYEGREGIREVCEDTLKQAGSEILFISSLSDIYKIVSPSYDTDRYIPERLEKKIRFRMLVPKDAITQKMAERDREELRQTKFLPKEFSFNATQFIYQNKIAYVSSEKELIGAIIESADIANLERQKYELIWKSII